MFWLIVALMIAAFAAVLALPLLRKSSAPVEEGGAAALQSRLDDIDRGEEANLLTAADAAEARLEAKREALSHSAKLTEAAASRRLRFAAILFIAAAPLAAVWIYVEIGAPDFQRRAQAAPAAADPAEAIAALPPVERQAMIENMVEGLAAELRENPENVDGWRMLARSYAVLGKAPQSADAYRELLKRAEGDAEDWRGLANAMVAGEPDPGDDELDRVLKTLLEKNPDDPLALYYLGLSARAEGDAAQAAAHWRRLLSVLPPGAPVAPAVEKLIAEASANGTETGESPNPEQ